jgi:hypothetical protein
MTGLFRRLAGRATGADDIAEPRLIALFEETTFANHEAIFEEDEETGSTDAGVGPEEERRAPTTALGSSSLVEPASRVSTPTADAELLAEPRDPAFRMSDTVAPQFQAPKVTVERAPPPTLREPERPHPRVEARQPTAAPSPGQKSLRAEHSEPKHPVEATLERYTPYSSLGWPVTDASEALLSPKELSVDSAKPSEPVRPTIDITIGRIEVRAPQTTAAPERTRRRTPAARKPLDLYLNEVKG